VKRQRATLGELLQSREGQQLEFKSTAALDDELILPRSVCSFLNAKGGTVLVGVRDDRSIEGVADAEVAAHRVEDRLASMISPRAAVEVEVEPGPLPGSELLRITVPAAAELHAVSSTKGRFLVPVRQGSRTVVLDWLEIERRLGTRSGRTRAPKPGQTVAGLLSAWIERCEKKSPILAEGGGLYLVLQCDLDSRVEDLKPRLERALIDPSSLGVGYGEGSFADGRGEVRHRTGVLCSGVEVDGYRWLEVTTKEAFVMRFATRLDGSWSWGQSLDEQRASQLIHPYALSQTVSSCASLGAELIRGHASRPTAIEGALELCRLRDRVLPPGPPGPFGYRKLPTWPKTAGDPAPAWHSMDVEDFVERPHALAKLLLDALYREFGWDASKVPFYDSTQSPPRFVYS
jgi:hypothetical protein